MHFHQTSLSTKIKVTRNFCTVARYGHGYACLHVQSQTYHAVIRSTELILSFQKYNTEPQLILHIPAKYPSMPNCDAASHYHTAYETACGSSNNNLPAKITDNIKIKIGCMGSEAGRRPTGPKILKVIDNGDDLCLHSLLENRSHQLLRVGENTLT